MTKSSPRAEELNELLTFFLFELHLFIVCVCMSFISLSFLEGSIYFSGL